jgi:hypothetical protein
MMKVLVITSILVSNIGNILSFKFPHRLSSSGSIALVNSKFAIYDTAETAEEVGRDLTGHSLWVKFSGFGGEDNVAVEDMNFGIELQENFQANYSRGLESAYPGFWRVIKYDDGRETLEVTQPGMKNFTSYADNDTITLFLAFFVISHTYLLTHLLTYLLTYSLSLSSSPSSVLSFTRIHVVL